MHRPETLEIALATCDTPFDLLRGTAVRQRFAPHMHDTFAIGAIEHGAARTRYRGLDVIHGPGDIVVIDPGEMHTGEPIDPTGWSYRMLYVPADVLARFGTADGVAPRFGRTAIQDPQLSDRLLRLHAELARGADALEDSSRMAAVLSDLVTRHARRPAALAGERPDGEGLARVREYLHAHAGRTIRLADLTGIAGCSPFHLIRQFRRRYGVPPHRYLMFLRVEHARALLRQGVTVADAALEAGFSDQAHLTRRFKGIVGVPPGQYASAVRRAIGDNRRARN